MQIPYCSFRGLAISLLCIVQTLNAQISDSGVYFGKLGTQDYALALNGDSLSFYLVDRANSRLDWGLGTLSARRQTNFTTTSGRLLSITSIQSGTVLGSFGGTAFSAAMEKSTGAFSSIAYNFAGTIGTSTGTQANSLTSMLLFVKASGKVLLLIPASTGSNGGVGLVSAADGRVTVSMSNNQTWSFLPDVSLTGLTGNISVRNSTGLLIETRPFILYQGFQPSLINIATRGVVTATQSMTGGFVIQNGAKTVLIRAIGPTLGGFGVNGANNDPALTLYMGQTAIASNDNWGSSANSADIVAAASTVGAFALSSSSKDAVILVRLEPGAYTAAVTSPTSGEALIEVYEVGAH